jgi:hypothetical protein
VLAQLSGKLIEVSVFDAESRWVWPILSMVKKAKFWRFVRPGDVLILHAEITVIRGESALVSVVGRVGEDKTCEAELMFVFNPDNLESDESQVLLERLERENLKNLWAGYDAWSEGLCGAKA